MEENHYFGKVGLCRLILRQFPISRDFPGGTVAKNPPASVEDTGLIPGPGRFHMTWSN